MFGFTKEELRIFKPLTSPHKIQDFIDSIPMNFEDTYSSPRVALRKNRAHCMEGAMIACVALRLIGHKPLVVDLKSRDDDDDHVVAVFQIDKHWGAISKTNHGVLRYREPIYKTIRELVMSYFHEYFLNDGAKTLRSYSLPVDLSKLDKKGWMTSEGFVDYVPEYIDEARHYPILSKKQLKNLRSADTIEIAMGKLVEWKK